MGHVVPKTVEQRSLTKGLQAFNAYPRGFGYGRLVADDLSFDPANDMDFAHPWPVGWRRRAASETG